MKLIEVCYESVKRTSALFEVSDEEYQKIYEGELPDHIKDQLADTINNQSGMCCDEEIDWTVEDAKTGKMLQDWRN